MAKAVLVINDVDFVVWLPENGLNYTTVERVMRSVVFTNGKQLRKAVNKQKIDVALFDMDDSELFKVENALMHQPCVVSYTDKKGIIHTGEYFYATPVSARVSKVVGNTTYWTGISFSLEEQ